MDTITGREIDSDHKFWLVFEQAAVGVAIISPMGRYLRANPVLCRMLGYTEEQLTGMTLADTAHSEDALIANDLWNDLLSGEVGSGSAEMRFLRRDGQTAWGSFSMSLLRDASGLLMQAVAVVEDITGCKEAQMELEQARKRYQAIWDALGDFVSINDHRGDFLFASSASAEFTGYTSTELVGTNLFRYIHPDDQAAVYRAFKAFGEGSSDEVRVRYRAFRKDGSYTWLEMTARPFGGEFEREIVCVSRSTHDRRPEATQDVPRSEQRQGAEGEAHLLHSETSNGVRDRSYMDELLGAGVVSRRSAGFPFGVVLVDIDNFAALNSTYSPAAGDEILDSVARALQQTCRAEDTVGRAGDDEFLVMLPNTSPGGTIVVGERLVQNVEALEWPDLPLESPVTISAGATCVTYGADLTLPELMGILQNQLKQAKESGRNRLVMNARQGLGARG